MWMWTYTQLWSHLGSCADTWLPCNIQSLQVTRTNTVMTSFKHRRMFERMSKNGRMVLQNPVLGRHSLANVFKHTNHIGVKGHIPGAACRAAPPSSAAGHPSWCAWRTGDSTEGKQRSCSSNCANWFSVSHSFQFLGHTQANQYFTTKHIKNYLRKNNIPQFIIYMCIAAYKSRCSLHGNSGIWSLIYYFA